ncbi:two-component system sensor histidine kinase MtrB [Nocardiopsis sp. Huas11]|uniref:sensor histidine kinase n=1 Tax=Nocardiopsis sp. Huas11 TaxID=2183912 RepID=UPI000EB1EA56|nr:HAMP domain-containing sensor histidine kinase [Nocardiopsis sp. Huas11]RKS09281.1 two-component system sensor histidine kinase MtrB [Nocardiopsis sp. Huas11]
MRTSRWPRPRGLRARLLAAFVLVTVLGAAASAWAGADSASSALVSSHQHRITETVAAQIAGAAPQLTYPPDQEALDRLSQAVGGEALVAYEDLTSAGAFASGLVTDELRSAVRREHDVVAQRITREGRSWLLVGTPVMFTAPDGTRSASGIEVYALRDLAAVESEIDGLTLAAFTTATAALPLSVLLALLAARGVLRPVRDLRDTAGRLASGDLDARAEPQGADELAELTAAVNEMAASLQESMAMKERMRADARRFVADVSHELRTPLSTLAAVVEVLESSTDGVHDDARESARMAISETHRLIRLVEDLMEVSRFDAGTARLHVEEVDVVDTVRACLRFRGWTDRVEVQAPERVVLRLDRRRLDLVLANLVGNALRHGAPPVRVAVHASAGGVRVTVTDAGPGLGEEVLPHVFDRFYKADRSRTRTPGSGLGLGIARENARLHGGDLTAADTGSGARFDLVLPEQEEEQ